MTLERGRIISIDARGRIALDADGRTIVGQVLSGGGWVGDAVEGRFQPGLQLWRNVGNGVTSAVYVQLTEVRAPAGDARAAAPVPLAA